MKKTTINHEKGSRKKRQSPTSIFKAKEEQKRKGFEKKQKNKNEKDSRKKNWQWTTFEAKEGHITNTTQKRKQKQFPRTIFEAKAKNENAKGRENRMNKKMK